MRVAAKAQLAAEVLRAYVRVRLLLRRSDLPGAVEILRRRSLAGHAPADALAVGLRLGRAVVRTLRLVPGDSRCLVRSLVLLDLLASRSIEAELVIGVAPPGSSDALQAHAWVERQGVPLLRDDEAEFPRLVSI
jgi:Transglutaminase-like superfamily